MKSKITTTALSFLLLQSAFGAPSKDWDKEYAKLCSYDKAFCGKLKNSDGTYVRPKKEIVVLLKELAPYIEKTAKQLGVDPRAIAGSIMAENSLNVGISDQVQNLLVKMGVANKGEVLGKSFSYGLGQLNFPAAREGENYVAKLENRKPLSDEELSKAITIPEKSIYLVGAVIRKVQDDYKKQGMDISDKPEILTTLYNLGKSEERAAASKNNKTLPKSNFFGFFVDKYIDDLAFLKTAPKEAVAKTAKAAEPLASKESSSKEGALASVATLGKSNSSIMIPMKMEKPSSQKIMLAFNKSMPLYSSPPTCTKGDGYGATDIQKKYSSMKAYSVTAIADKNKSFKSIAPTVDCEANAWQLIELESGEVGWIKKDDLEKNTTKLLVDDKKCKPVVDTKCAAQVKDQLKKLKIDYPGKNSGQEVVARPFSLSENVAFTNPDWSCVEKKVEVEEDPHGGGVNLSPGASKGSTPGMGMGYGYGVVGTMSPPVKLMPKKSSLEDLQTLTASIELKQREIEKKYNVLYDDPINPFASVSLDALKKGINYCVNKQKYKLSNCQISKEDVSKILADLDPNKIPTVDDKELYQLNMISALSGNAIITKDDLVKRKQNAAASGFPMGFGYGYGSYIDFMTPDQYKVREGDEKKWSLEDVKASAKACSKSLEAVIAQVNQSNISASEKSMFMDILKNLDKSTLKVLNDSLDFLDKMSEEKREETWDRVQLHFIPVSKMCLSLDELFDLKREASVSSTADEYTCYYGNLNVLENHNELMLKNILKESMMTPMGISSLSTQFSQTFNIQTVMALGLMDTPAIPGYSMAVAVTPPSSYCPNKTAEMIEDIMKNNSCVEHVYLPDQWMISRLNELGDKVIYRPFEKEDQFAFDVEKTQCN